MTELKASSDLDAGVTFNGINILHNGVTWRPQSTAAISLHNQAIKVVNSGGSSEGVLALPALSLVEPNTTYIMECDIVEVSPGITELAFYAIDNTGAPYRVTSVEAGTGHRSIVFTTGATLGTYLTFRASARPATAGLYFVVDNFVFRKYKTVDQVQHYGTDFSAAVMNGTDVYDNGRIFRPWTSLLTSLSVVGTVDKKIEVSAGTVNESRLRTDMPAIGGVPYLVKFTLGQAEPDKRAFIELLYRTGGGTWTTFIQGLFYTGSGDYQLNFTLPAGADELRVGFLRNSTGSIYDGLGVPYTIDNFSVTRITPQEQMIVTVCDPPPGGNTTALYRFGFNGKENDNEVKGEGNQLDYGSRVYDPRIGKFLSVDPLQTKLPDLTPYHYTTNNPINFLDLDGKDTVRFQESSFIIPQRSTKLDGIVLPSTGSAPKYKTVVIQAPGADVFYYDVILTVMEAHGPVAHVRSKEFFPNIPWQKTGITQSSGTYLPWKKDDPDFVALAKLASPELLSYLKSHDNIKYGGLEFTKEQYKEYEQATAIAGTILLVGGLVQSGFSLMRIGGVEASFSVMSGAGGVSQEMSVVRMIQKGEKLDDIINEAKGLTWDTGNEHALVTLANGDRALVSGGPGGIIFKQGQLKTLFGHTHPTSAPPSNADATALKELGQSKQYVLHGGQISVVRPKN